MAMGQRCRVMCCSVTRAERRDSSGVVVKNFVVLYCQLYKNGGQYMVLEEMRSDYCIL
jgi:hypothetical protein